MAFSSETEISSVYFTYCIISPQIYILIFSEISLEDVSIGLRCRPLNLRVVVSGVAVVVVVVSATTGTTFVIGDG